MATNLRVKTGEIGPLTQKLSFPLRRSPLPSNTPNPRPTPDPDPASRSNQPFCHSTRTDRQTDGHTPLFNALTFQNGLEYCNFNFKMFNENYFSILYVNLVIFGPATPECTGAKAYIPRRSVV